MREYSFRKDGFTFERVSKATARRVFNNDMPIMLCPCNLRPETGLFSTVVQNGKHLDTTFETMLNTFEYYMTPEGCRLYNIPMYETETPDIIEYWRKQKPRIVWNG